MRNSQTNNMTCLEAIAVHDEIWRDKTFSLRERIALTDVMWKLAIKLAILEARRLE